MRGVGGVVRVLALSAVALAGWAGALDGQRAPASPFLPQGHWVHDALLRTADPGLAGVAVRGRRTITWCEAVTALTAASDGTGASSERARLALDRFREEFALDAPAGCGIRSFAAAPSAGLRHRSGWLLTGTGYGRDDIPRSPPVPVDDVAEPAALLRLSAATGPRLAGMVEAGYARGDWQVESLQAVLALGPLLFWGGRRPLGFGPGEGGGVVFGDQARVTGGGFQLGVPLLGPGFLRHLGPIHFETMLARSGPSGPARNPWLWAARGSIQPHPRLLLAINRGAIFGGEGNIETTFRDVVYILIGKHAGGGSILENQIVAVEAVYRPPLPLGPEAYVEWGLEDSAGAWRNEPGVVWGVAFDELPGLPAIRVGVEHASFARSCCGNPIWYRHIFLAAGWTQDGRPLGHPLAGHGEEWLLYGSGGLLEERLQLRGSLALRDRWSENLYAPDREGPSRAGTLRASFLTGRWTLESDFEVEDGSGWTETSMRTTLRYSP